jgi:hypothetical protein
MEIFTDGELQKEYPQIPILQKETTLHRHPMMEKIKITPHLPKCLRQAIFRQLQDQNQ